MKNQDHLETAMTIQSKLGTLATINEKLNRASGQRHKTLELMRDIVEAEIALLKVKLRVQEESK